MSLIINFNYSSFDTNTTTSVKITSGQWTYVEFKISSSDIVNSQGNLKSMCFGLRYNKITDKAKFKETIYIAGFDVYAESKKS